MPITSDIGKLTESLLMLNFRDGNFQLMTGDTNSTSPLVIASEILKGREILPKGLVLQDECFGKNYLRKTYYSLMFFIAYAFKGQVHVFAGRVKIVSHSSCRTSAILKYFCPLDDLNQS